MSAHFPPAPVYVHQLDADVNTSGFRTGTTIRRRLFWLENAEVRRIAAITKDGPDDDASGVIRAE
jgi:hypothetical protein